MALPQQNGPATVQQLPRLLSHSYSSHPPPPLPSTGHQDGLQVLQDLHQSEQRVWMAPLQRPGGLAPENGHSVSAAVHHESSSSRAGMAGGLTHNVSRRRKLMRASQVSLRSVLLACPNLTNWFSGLRILPELEGEMRRGTALQELYR